MDIAENERPVLKQQIRELKRCLLPPTLAGVPGSSLLQGPYMDLVIVCALVIVCSRPGVVFANTSACAWPCQGMLGLAKVCLASVT